LYYFAGRNYGKKNEKQKLVKSLNEC